MPENTKWYLLCRNCGEVFDDIEVSVGHDGVDDEDNPCWVFDDSVGEWRIRPIMSIVPEEEAF